jgi:hypothetical protein
MPAVMADHYSSGVADSCVSAGGYAYEKASMGVAIANSFCQKNSMGGAVLNGLHACNT